MSVKHVENQLTNSVETTFFVGEAVYSALPILCYGTLAK